jgi:site-specific recombinase XerD
MLEYCYAEKRTLADFRRGPLGLHFDRFAAYLKARGYSPGGARRILSKCCLFNTFLIEQGVTTCAGISQALRLAFLEAYLRNSRTAADYSPRASVSGPLRRLFSYLTEIRVYHPPKPKLEKTPYSWILHPYLRHLRQECHLSAVTVQRATVQVSAFLAALGPQASRLRLKTLSPQRIEHYIQQHLKDSPENLSALVSTLRRFFCYCAAHRHTQSDFSGLIPSVRRYRHASLPKGMEDSALDRVLKGINQDTPIGARDYAIMVLMMAYGVRGVSVAQLLLDDLDWQRSLIRIRAQKGGKEVVLPLMETVGKAVIRYLRHRNGNTPFREVFLSTKAPFVPISGLAISHIVRNYMSKAGVELPGAGSRTLRHSWAIRALEHDTSIKAIADVLGHRYVDTTFIYAKADLKTLREVAMPWPKQG